MSLLLLTQARNVNVWFLGEFLQYDFPRDILTPAPNLVAANHFSVSIAGTFFAIIQGLLCHGQAVQCLAIVYVSADVKAPFLSYDTLATLGVLSFNFPSLSKHTNAEMQKALVNLLLSLMRTSRALLLVVVPHRAIKLFIALTLNVLPYLHPHGRYHSPPPELFKDTSIR